MSQQPGYLTSVKKGGASVAFTEEPTTKVTANTVFQITDTSKQIVDPAEAVTVEVDPAGDGSWEAATGYTFDHYSGTVTFASDQGSTALVRVSGSYVPTLTVATARATTISAERTMVEVTPFGTTGWKSFIYGMLRLTGTLDLVEDGLTDHDSGGGTQKFLADFLAGTAVLLEIRPGAQGSKIRTWATLTKADNDMPLDGVVGTKLAFSAGGRGTAPSASFVA